MRRAHLKAALAHLVDNTGRVEDMLAVLAEIYRERAREPEYAERTLNAQMHQTARVLDAASDAVESIFED